MTYEYYEEQAQVYDHLDLTHQSRRDYTSRIEELIGSDLKEYDNIRDLLSLACGTGRRSLRIRNLSDQNYDITGVDLSKNMCQLAQKKGIETYRGPWLEISLPAATKFDAATCLYSFGHLPDSEERVQFLEKLSDHLHKGGPFYLDVFNIADKNEWGPQALRDFERHQLDQKGFERGDVFYKRTGGKAIGFLHYFSEKEISDLLEKTGFRVVHIWYIGYAKQAGQILKHKDEGALFIKAEKV